MKIAATLFTTLMFAIGGSANADEITPDPASDILVTFANTGAKTASGGFSAPYSNRKRYAIAAAAQRHASDIADQYALTEVDHWPIKSLSVYCFVYRLSAGQDREAVIAQLKADTRIESVQLLQEFETGTTPDTEYNDTYVNLQHGLEILGVTEAHRHSRGEDVRVAIIDSHVDLTHEDLDGRINEVFEFLGDERLPDKKHGTAVASIIGAHTNNAKGIAGIAPAAELDIFVACWAAENSGSAVCDSISLAKALDTLLDDPPEILNLSLTGPYDQLLARLLREVLERGVIVIAARPGELNTRNDFPASLHRIIGVSSISSDRSQTGPGNTTFDDVMIYAPGDQIMVAIPGNGYDFRSGSSLATAHVSGVVALLLALVPDLSYENVVSLLEASQQAELSNQVSVHACGVLQLADGTRSCLQDAVANYKSELKPDT